MATTFIKGEGLILYIYDTTWKPIGCLTSNSLSRTKSIIEAVTKCDPGETIRQGGTKSYEISFDANYIDTTSATGDATKLSHDALMAIFDATTVQQWKMDSGLTDAPAYYGDGIMTSLDMTAGSGDEFTTFSGAISGSGAIVTVDPNI